MEPVVNLPRQALQFYVLTKRWASDLDFFKVETAFFHRLIDDFFTGLSAPENHEQLKEIGGRLSELEHDEKETASRLDRHLKQMQLMSEDIVPADTEELADEHLVLEQLVDKLFTDYREVKRQLFMLTAEIMRSDAAHS